MTDLGTNIISKTKPLIEYLKKQQDNKKFISTVELSSTLFLIAFFLLFAIRPTLLVIAALIGEVNSKKILTAGMKSKISNVVQAQDSFSQVQQRYLIIDASLPSSPKYSHAANQVIGAAQASGVDLSDLNFTLPKDKGGSHLNYGNKNIQTLSISAGTNSKFTSALIFINRLLTNRRYFNFSSISMSAPKADQNPTTSPTTSNSKDPSLQFLVNLFYWKQQ